MKRIWAVIVITVLLGVGVLAIYVWVPDDVTATGCHRTENAAWVSVDWVAEPVDDVTLQSLIDDAAVRDIRYLYPYVSYLRADGTFNPTYDRAAEFVRQFRATNQDILLIAWVGVPLKNEAGLGIEGWAELKNKDTRQQIVAFAKMLVNEIGFDGIHLNVETVYNHDPDYLLLLEETQAALGVEPVLSIAGSHWMPDALNNLPPIKDLRWTTDYYQQVSQHVDQIAIMTYDSHTFHPALYRLWMREEVRGISGGLVHYDGQVLVGISVSSEQTPSHKPSAENLHSGLAGLCAGLNADRYQVISGISVYADWDFSEADWNTWQLWEQEQ